MKRVIKYLLLDFDDTLINSSAIHEEAFKQTLFEFEYQPIFDYRSIAGLDTIQAFISLGYSYNKSKELAIRKSTIYNQIAANNPPSFTHGMLDFLDSTKLRDIKVSIVSSGSKLRITNTLKDLGVLDRFQFILTKEDVNRSKPDPELYLKALSKTNLSSENVIAVEDSEQGCLSANRAGLNVWHLISDDQKFNFSNLRGNIFELQKWLDL